MLIIGSTAIKHYFPDFNREPKDLDVVIDIENPSINNSLKEDWLYNPIILKYQKDGYLIPELLLTLKMSHLFWPTNWDKHMWDVQFLLSKGFTYNKEILYELVDFWEDYLPKIRRSNLNLSKEEFFTNAVNKDSDEHDYLHTLLTPIPTYTKILKDGSEVEPDENKWYELSWIDKCNIILEETIVMMVERNKNPKLDFPCFHQQLNTNIQRHFPKFVALFAIINYIHLSQFPKQQIYELRCSISRLGIL